MLRKNKNRQNRKKKYAVNVIEKHRVYFHQTECQEEGGMINQGKVYCDYLKYFCIFEVQKNFADFCYNRHTI